jgi:hypothetical protein
MLKNDVEGAKVLLLGCCAGIVLVLARQTLWLRNLYKIVCSEGGPKLDDPNWITGVTLDCL